MPAKSVLIELDSIHSSTLLKCAKTGVMPFLQKLLSNGKRGEICYEIPLQVASWFSLHCGQSVKEHQRIGFEELKTGSYSATPANYGLQPGMMYWEALDAAGLNVLVLNNICGAPRPLTNGVHLCEFSSHSAGHYRSPLSSPPELAQTLQQRFPEELFHVNDWGNMKYTNIDRLVESTCANIERKCAVFCELIESRSWDHVHLCLDDLHSFGHMLWHRMDVNQGHLEQVNSDKLLKTAFQNLDGAIKQLVTKAGVGTNLMIVALAGIGQKNTWSHCLDDIIECYLSRPAGRRFDLYGLLGRLWVKAPHNITRHLLPIKTRIREKYLAPQRARNLAYAWPKNEESGGIRVNLHGREPSGSISAGKEYDELCIDLTDALSELRDVETGIPLVDEVVNVPRLLGIDPLENLKLPDLVVVWTRLCNINVVHSSRLGRIIRKFEPPRSGDHLIDGLFVTHGPIWNNVKVRSQTTPLDFAPTLADIHNVRHDKRWTGESLLG